MSGFTEYGASQVVAGNALPQSYYAKLHIGDPGVNGTSNAAIEETRLEITLEAGETDDRVNDGDITWETVPATEDVSFITLWDDSMGGNAWLVGQVSPVLSLGVGGDGTILAGNIRINLSRHGS